MAEEAHIPAGIHDRVRNQIADAGDRDDAAHLLGRQAQPRPQRKVSARRAPARPDFPAAETEPLGKGLAQFLQRLGGEFFDEEFEEQVVGGHGKKSKGGRVRANVSMGESVPRLIAQGTDD